MEGESTSAVLSGFVLGALSFQHLNTDSDSVSRGAGRGPASLRMRPRVSALPAAAARVPARELPDAAAAPASASGLWLLPLPGGARCRSRPLSLFQDYPFS